MRGQHAQVGTRGQHAQVGIRVVAPQTGFAPRSARKATEYLSRHFELHSLSRLARQLSLMTRLATTCFHSQIGK